MCLPSDWRAVADVLPSATSVLYWIWTNTVYCCVAAGSAAQGYERVDGTSTSSDQHNQRGTKGRSAGGANFRDEIGSARFRHRSRKWSPCPPYASCWFLWWLNRFNYPFNCFILGFNQMETDSVGHEQTECVVSNCGHERGHGQRHHPHIR